MTICPLLTVFGFLSGRTTTMRTGDVLFLLGLGLDLIIVLGLITASAEVDTVFEDVLKIVHRLNGGTVLRL